MREQGKRRKRDKPRDLCQKDHTVGAGAFGGDTADEISRAPGCRGYDAVENREQSFFLVDL